MTIETYFTYNKSFYFKPTTTTSINNIQHYDGYVVLIVSKQYHRTDFPRTCALPSLVHVLTK